MVVPDPLRRPREGGRLRAFLMMRGLDAAPAGAAGRRRIALACVACAILAGFALAAPGGTDRHLPDGGVPGLVSPPDAPSSIAALPHGDGVWVANPKSYPLVGGTWRVDLEISGGGDLAVEAVDGTEFGRDIEFSSLYRRDGGGGVPPEGPGHQLVFGNVGEGSWHFEVVALTDGPHHLRFHLGGETAYASNTASLANVTSSTADGRYRPGDTIDVRVQFTEPVSLDWIPIVDGRQDAEGGTFHRLDGATLGHHRPDRWHPTTPWSPPAADDDGVQIIDITDPANPLGRCQRERQRGLSGARLSPPRSPPPR